MCMQGESRRKPFVWSWVFIALIGGVVGCGWESTPTERDAREILEDEIEEEAEGRMELARLEATDMLRQESMGMEYYTIEYEGEVEFLEDAGWSGPYEYAGSRSVNFRTLDPDEVTYWDRAPIYDAGQRVEIEGDVRFERTETGWRMTSFKAYSSESCEGIQPL